MTVPYQTIDPTALRPPQAPPRVNQSVSYNPGSPRTAQFFSRRLKSRTGNQSLNMSTIEAAGRALTAHGPDPLTPEHHEHKPDALATLFQSQTTATAPFIDTQKEARIKNEQYWHGADRLQNKDSSYGTQPAEGSLDRRNLRSENLPRSQYAGRILGNKANALKNRAAINSSLPSRSRMSELKQ